MDNTAIEQAIAGEDVPNGNKQGEKPANVSGTLKTMTMGVVGMLLANQAAYFLRQGPALEVFFYAVGRLLGPVIITVFVFALFQIFRKFRTSRARWLIVLWTNVVMLLSAISETVQTFFGVAG